MIPPFGRQHEPVLEPPVDFRFRFTAATRPLLALRGIRPSTTGVRIFGGLLRVRFGRRRVSCLVTEVERARVEASPARRPPGGRRSGEVLDLRTCSGSAAVLRLAAPGTAGRRRPRELALTVENPSALVAYLASRTGLPSVRGSDDRQAR